MSWTRCPICRKNKLYKALDLGHRVNRYHAALSFLDLVFPWKGGASMACLHIIAGSGDTSAHAENKPNHFLVGCRRSFIGCICRCVQCIASVENVSRFDKWHDVGRIW